MGVGAGVYMYDVVVGKFTFAISSPDEFLFSFVCEISRELLNGFAPNSQERRVWSLSWTSLNASVNGQRSRSPWTKTGFSGEPLN